MPYRRFTDSQGTLWRVWDVRPSRLDRRFSVRRVRVHKILHVERRFLATRRIDLALARLFFPPGEAGWLCFECREEKRRLAPVPDGWDRLPEEGLLRLLRPARGAVAD